MYLYFDSNGNLKEQINDYPLRNGNDNVNKLYVYVENTTFDAIWTKYRFMQDDVYPSESTWQISTEIETKKVPFNKDRDLKFFKYGVVYDFYVIDIPSEVLNKAGSIPVGETRFTATCIIQLLCVLNEESVISLNPVAMAVDSTLLKVAQDFNINVAQWNELIKRVGYILSIIPSEATPIYKHSVVLTTKHNVEEYELTFKIEIITNKDDELSGNEVLNVLNLGELQTQKLVSYRVVNVNLSDVIDLIYLGCNKEQASFVLLDEDTEIYRYISSDDLAVLSVDDSVDKI